MWVAIMVMMSGSMMSMKYKSIFWAPSQRDATVYSQVKAPSAALNAYPCKYKYDFTSLALLLYNNGLFCPRPVFSSSSLIRFFSQRFCVIKF